ncbi:hypothetical protein AVEN_56665-1 [Araneus ventricosus]|uniref:Uncharacterized protein n=1 Tax=Araneus ventricosus TaxID=182803 RepID=A0A4Y2RUS0_ARAVE|nr:hypothetical protein AVEN_56665-1 [Araneus ventricosus]
MGSCELSGNMKDIDVTFSYYWRDSGIIDEGGLDSVYRNQSSDKPVDEINACLKVSITGASRKISFHFEYESSTVQRTGIQVSAVTFFENWQWCLKLT